MENVEKIKELLTKLSIEQLNAIDVLITGASDREVAEKVGVSRQVVTNWRLYHPEFQAELGRRREAVWSLSADKMRSLLPRALAILDETFDDSKNPDRLKLALEIINRSGIFEAFKSGHHTDAMRIIEAKTPSKSFMVLDQPDEASKMETMRRLHKQLKEGIE
jgi:transcriptional regulator with XRE-family HTH domain